MILAGTPDGVYRAPHESFEEAERVLDGVSVRALHARDGAVFAATDSGLRRTTDGGDTWTDLDLPVGDVHSVGSSDRAVYAGVEPGGPYRSPDGGESWNPVEGFAAFAAGAEWPTSPHRDHAWVRSVGDRRFTVTLL
ncbi:hypothetical protein BRD00_10535 [Halobacteriales archaeon QS_8_69_26]|nr:MAG: hypothetical protein BRD00_10535 [Halobacteriales archaeon QS_8_69_26]